MKRRKRQTTLLDAWKLRDIEDEASAAADSTERWETVNCVTGCEHGCRYCYAKHFAVRLFSQVADDDSWREMQVRPADVSRRRKPPPQGRGVWFPSSHDVTPSVLEPCIRVAESILAAGTPSLLIATKPHLVCVRALCDALQAWRRRVLFRMCITATDDALLAFWEPGAPLFAERVAALQLAHERGFATAVAVTPALDTARVAELCDSVAPFVTRRIEVGVMNRVSERVRVADDSTAAAVAKVLQGQSDEALWRMRTQLLHFGRLIRFEQPVREAFERVVASKTPK